MSANASPPLEALLTLPTKSSSPLRADGIALGTIQAILTDGSARVNIPALSLIGIAARTMVALAPAQVGSHVALGFEGGDPVRPIIMGLMLTTPALHVVADGQHQVIEATDSLELRCGQASIQLVADGRIELRGTYITSHATATQRIRGGSVQIN